MNILNFEICLICYHQVNPEVKSSLKFLARPSLSSCSVIWHIGYLLSTMFHVPKKRLHLKSVEMLGYQTKLSKKVQGSRNCSKDMNIYKTRLKEHKRKIREIQTIIQ